MASKSNALVRLKQHNTQTDLQLLKQQINPHFLFNTLNNLYALSRKKSDQTPEVILQLAELMHYVVYQAQEPLVPISQEVDYINDYIGLQSIRLADHRNIHVTSRLDDEQAPVAPLLLIILIENAFKHGMELSNNDAQLTIDIALSNNQLAFRCVNSLSHSSENAPITYGLGLSNLIRRLELIYPQRYQLELSEMSQTFVAQLTINLDSTASSEGNNA
ncbi:sensor histidine kinase [Psychrobium sp. nBUS_13]|uniref:sensor histidine kinase n=1 Tax=Psychrobium sp. nBUS_13 TaxID=3395319 RepID=UPI003EC12B68